MLPSLAPSQDSAKENAQLIDQEFGELLLIHITRGMKTPERLGSLLPILMHYVAILLNY